MNTKTTTALEPLVPEHVLQKGDAVIYRGPDGLDEDWTVEAVLNSTRFVRCGRGKGKHEYRSQCFPASALIKVDREEQGRPKFVPPKTRQDKPKKPTNVGDKISALLAEANTLDDMLRIAQMAGFDVMAIRAKIEGLQHGLRRMNIGNRLRNAWKRGEIDPDTLYDQYMGTS